MGANAAQTIELGIGNFRTDNGTISALTTTQNVEAVTADPDATPPIAAVAAVKQVDEVTLGGSFAQGDVISVKIGTTAYTYTVTGDEADNDEIAAALASEIDDSSVVVTTAGSVITLTAATAGTATDAIEVSIVSDALLAGINSSSITTQSNSDSAIDALDDAMTVVNEARATMGATINRLSYAADNLTNVSINASESRSRVLDTDYAEATTELARTQIIQQAATAMLAQANQQQQTVLSLLQ